MRCSMRRRNERSAALCAIWIAATLFVVSPARAETAATTTTIAVVDFDYNDTSGEPTNQRAQHEARLKSFTQALRRDLEQTGAYRVVSLDCGAEPCTVKGLTPEELFEATKKAGARLLLFGGIHKMSTLVQWARVQVVDVEKNVVLDDRHLSFRGDNDESWRRAEAFVIKQLREQAAPQ